MEEIIKDIKTRDSNGNVITIPNVIHYKHGKELYVNLDHVITREREYHLHELETLDSDEE